MILNDFTKENLNKKRILNEQYYGNNKYTDRMDKLFEDLLNHVPELQKKSSVTSILPLIDPKVLNKFEVDMAATIKEMFNFSSVRYEVKPFASINSCTAALFVRDSLLAMNPKYNKEEYEYGVRYIKPTVQCTVYLASEMLTLPGVTPRLLTAVLLHEIGHNFFQEISFQACALNYFSSASRLVAIVVYTNDLINAISHPEKYKFHPSIAHYVISTVETLEIMLSGTLFVGDALNKISTIIKKIPVLNVAIKFGKYGAFSLMSITNQIFSLRRYNPFTIVPRFISKANDSMWNIIMGSKYRDEMFADNFATAYGYAKETIEFERLIEVGDIDFISSMANKTKFLRMYSDTLNSISEAFLGFDDIHPDTIARCIDQIDYLENNLKYVDNPEQKKIIKKDLEEAKEMYKIYQKDMEPGGAIYERWGFIKIHFLKKDIKQGGKIAYKFQLDQVKDHRIQGQWDALPKMKK